MRKPIHKGFTLIEVMTNLATLSVLAAVAYFVATNLMGDTKTQKLYTDVRTLNTAVHAYIASGGTIHPSATATDIIAKLKTVTSKENSRRLIGLSSSMVDHRLVGIPQTPEEVASDDLRVVWNPERLRFSLSESGAGFSGFTLDKNAAVEPAEIDPRATARLYAKVDPWVWDYQERQTSFDRPSAPILGTSATAPPPTPPPSPTKLVLQPPVYSTPSKTAPITEFDLSVTLTNPNPPGVSRVLYSLDGTTWIEYDGSPVMVGPNTSLESVVASIAPDEWIDSTFGFETYTATAVSQDDEVTTPETEGVLIDVTGNDTLAPSGPHTSPVTSIDGIALDPGLPVTLPSGATLTLLGDGSIYYDPNGEFAELSAGESAGDIFTYGLANGDTSTVTVTVAGVTQNFARERAYLGQDTPSGLYHIEIDPANESLNFADQILSGADYNSMGYNDADDQIYAWTRTGFNGLIRIDPVGGQITPIGRVSGIPDAWHYSGTVAPDGYYYLQKARNLYKIDIASRNLVKKITLSNSLNIHDIAFDPATELFFSIERKSNSIITIDPADGTVTRFPTAVALTKPWGAVYTDARGNVFGVNNGGGLYFVEKSTMSLRYLTGSPSSGNNDGAHSKAVVSSLARPHLFLDPDGSGLAKNGFYNRYEIGNDPVGIGDEDLKLVHLLGHDLTSAEVTLTNPQPGDTLSMAGSVTGIHSVVAADQVLMSGNRPLADYQQALRNVRFANTDPAAPLSPPRIFSVTVHDSEGNPSPEVKPIIFVVRPTGSPLLTGI